MTCGNIMKAKDVKLQKIDKSTNISCYGENSWKKIKMSNNHQKSYSDHRWIKMSMNHWRVILINGGKILNMNLERKIFYK